MRAAWCVALACCACGRVGFDARSTSTGGGDSGGDSGGDAGSGSATGFTFSADFDHVVQPSDGWSGTFSGGAQMALDPSAAVSAPDSLLVTIPYPAAGTAYLTEALPAITTSLVWSFDLELAETTAGAEVDLAQLDWDTPPGPCTDFGFYFVRDSTGPLVLQETYAGSGCNAGNTNDNLTSGSAGSFEHLELDLTQTGSGSHLQVLVNGVLATDKLVPQPITGSPLDLRLGVPAQRQTTAEWQLRYDNVVVDVP
jgi:hypothetical protein